MKNNGTPRATSIFILTFDERALPDNVEIGYKICDVREYNPRPRRCYNCQNLGHGSKRCRTHGILSHRTRYLNHIKTREKLSYKESKRIATKTLIGPTNTFANAVRCGLPDNIRTFSSSQIQTQYSKKDRPQQRSTPGSQQQPTAHNQQEQDQATQQN